ncbi:MAG: hypothetical protein ACREJ3_09420, partial [Polyangiaceae bacterium]
RPRTARPLRGELIAALALGIAGACGVCVGGCDIGTQQDEPHGVGAPVHYTANVGPSEPLPANSGLELTFDRLLLPLSIVRQTFQLSSVNGQALTPTVTYDPVSRVVTVTASPSAPLTPGQTYRLTIGLPTSTTDLFGLRAIDGATLDPASPASITFLAGPALPPASPTAVDFCRDVQPIFRGSCAGLTCHSPPPDTPTAAGLVLTTPAGILATALRRVAQGSNTGPRPVAVAPSLRFGVDMPIIDPGLGAGQSGDPGDSWLLYKLLMAVPTPGDAGAITALSASERATLSSFIPGREMPFPSDPGAPLDAPGAQLSIAQIETISTWIAQGAAVPGACP